mmetsp:Transcript_11240/g.18580  ORF Transcript_11240/g.18580 Transcript_11240/m.18580 type:complete len:321 (-) Transcript_11240:30-992(-)|eukprot:scaffold2300_cov138-Skeletonema_menzelii.AAC.3
MISYLLQAGPTHPKHGGHGSGLLPSTQFPIHPLLSFIVHYSIVIPAVFAVHDVFFKGPSGENIEQHEDTILRQTYMSRFLLIYTLILFTTRCASSFNAGRLRQHAVMYELTWLCNSTLLMGSITFGVFDVDGTNWLFRRRPLIATSCCIGVSIDQVLWYVDLVGYLMSGKFPVGVMKYLTWPQTLWIDRLTCTHHLWTIPLFIYASNKELGLDSFMLSVCIVTIKVCLSRWLTPHCIQAIKSKDDVASETKSDPQRYRYLNVNLCHELWRDITFSFLQISHDKPPGWLYLWRLLWRWQLFNYLVFVGVLSPLSRGLVSNL